MTMPLMLKQEMSFLKQVQSSAYLFAFSLLYSLDVFLSRPLWVCVSCLL